MTKRELIIFLEQLDAPDNASVVIHDHEYGLMDINESSIFYSKEDNTVAFEGE